MKMYLLFKNFFIFIFSNDDCQMYEKLFAKLCKQLNINITIQKNPTKLIMIFLDIELNIVNMTVFNLVCSSVREQTENDFKKINVVLKSKSISYKILESLVGLLYFACKMIVFEKSFLWHFYDALIASKREHLLKIDKKLKINCFWWTEFLPKWNDVCFLKCIKFVVKIYIHVSNNWNMKKYFLINEQTIVNIDVFKIFFIKLHQRLQNKHINTKKLINVKYAFCIWLFSFYEYHIIIYDNN